ncbi:HD domain-containing protein [Yinghuangia sp. ASG 101]|uniref:HD domain-containing protein n=1 Tax=Yinghuangia sp. ASG 101 TaxID=2896848 RepID=UPI001E439205|nr:HD domain-containing protein [Yinghuangia sp. ASG 101]UGQ10589.1 HD domain-containing protein [Yinghuangia sp. ASG 101]
MGLSGWAYHLAEDLLAGPLPQRWAHSQGVAQRAHALGPILGSEAELLYAAAVLHDIGYAPALAKIGFHPLDGARYLRDVAHADERVTRLVAHHSCALLEAEERGLAADLTAEFPPETDHLVDALIYCDMTTSPNGDPTTAEARIAEILSRYGNDSIVGRFIRRAQPEIHAAVARVRERVAVTTTPSASPSASTVTG